MKATSSRRTFPSVAKALATPRFFPWITSVFPGIVPPAWTCQCSFAFHRQSKVCRAVVEFSMPALSLSPLLLLFVLTLQPFDLLTHHPARFILCAGHFFRSIPALSGAAIDWKIHPPLVRRRSGSLDDLHVVLSGAAADGICLRAFYFALAQAALPGNSASRSSCGSSRLSADPAFGFVEATRKRKSHVSHPRASWCQSWLAVFCALFDRTLDAAMVSQENPGATPY